MSEHSKLIPFIYKYKKQLQKIEKKVGMEYQKEYKQGYIVRMVTKVKGRPYFFLSSVFGCLFTRHLKLILSSLFK